MTNWKDHQSWFSYNYKKLPKNSTSTILQLKNSTSDILQPFGIWSKLERWKNLISGCHELTANQQITIFLKWLSSVILHNNKQVLNWIVMCNEKWFYMTTSNHQLSVCTEKFQSNSQSQTGTQTKGHGHWWSAAGLIHYIFLNPDKTISSEKCAQQINGMH